MSLKKLYYILTSCLLINISACTSVKLGSRAGKDIVLNSENYMQLNGIYSNNCTDTSQKNLWNSFESDSLGPYPDYKVVISPNDLNTLKVKILYEDSVVAVSVLAGHFKKGYFVVEREWTTVSILGPALWFLNNNLKYIGLDKSNNLVVLNAGRKVLVMLMLLPISIKKSQHENLYHRAKLVNMR